MNIEIANRLIELRKKSGLSQEQLAEKLGLSRQAVSKWERAEASPDTDNLICLAKIYNVSLDELLNSDQSVEEIAQEVKEENTEKENDKPKEKKSPYAWVEALIGAICMAIVVIVYILMGTLITTQNMWALLWPLFFFPPVISSFVGAILDKNPNKFCLPLLIVGVYCFVGMFLGIWHPTWVLFLAIPAYYGIVSAIRKNKDK